MLVLLIIFMVAAPLLTVGVPIDLPETAPRRSIPTRSRSPSRSRFNRDRSTSRKRDADRGSGAEARGDRHRPAMTSASISAATNADYGTIMKVMGGSTQAGFKNLGLVTLQEQDS
jgi:biopolymer transport protein TolR